MNAAQGVQDGSGDGLRCAVAAHALVQAPAATVAEWRRPVVPVGLPPPPAALLRHAEEQTLATLAAVYRATSEAGLTTSYRDWGIVAGSRFLGRASVAVVIGRFLNEGAWGVSPHVIPYRSLHTASGMLSLALGVHGPNFGVGGGPGCDAEALLAATTLLYSQGLPGVWLVLSRLEPEITPDPSGVPAPGTTVLALALALTPARDARLQLRIGPGTKATGSEFDLAALATLLERAGRDGLARGVLPGGMWLALEAQASGAVAPLRRSA